MMLLRPSVHFSAAFVLVGALTGTLAGCGAAEGGASDEGDFGSVASANTVDGGADGEADAAPDDRPFLPLTTARLSAPDNLGRPPTSADLTLEVGLDGLTPEDSEREIRAKLTNPIHSSNERFVSQSIRQAQKALTIGVWNLYAPGPRTRFLANFRNATITVLGTMSSVRPYVIAIQTPRAAVRYFAPANGRVLEELPTMRYPVIIRAEIQRSPDGTRITYPAWSAPVLAGVTSTITEGGSTPRPNP